MADKYIIRVLSHLKNQKHKGEISNELNDHIILHKSFLEEIGYDEETSEFKAEEKMGDADVVGEQFKGLEKESKRKMISIAITSALLLLINIIYIIFLSSDDISLFWNFISFFAVIVLSFIGIIYGYKKRNIFCICAGCLGSFSTIFSSNNYLGIFIADLFNKKNIFTAFYGIHEDPHQNPLFRFYSGGNFERIIYCFFLIIIIFTLINGIFILIRVKRLKNKKIDLKINKFFIISISALLIFISSVFGYTAYQTLTYKETLIIRTREELYELDKLFVSNLDTFRNGDIYEIVEVMNTVFGDNVSKEDIDSYYTEIKEDIDSYYGYVFKYKSIWNESYSMYVGYGYSYSDEYGFEYNIYYLAQDLNGEPLKINTEEEMQIEFNFADDNKNINSNDFKYPFELSFIRDSSMNSKLTIGANEENGN